MFPNTVFLLFLFLEVPISTAHAQSVYIPERININISCTSIGGPVPSITWTINNLTTDFSQTDVVHREMFSSGVVTLGNITSTLNIVDARYPAHDGVYTCTGTNTVSGLAYSSSDYITIQIQGM